MIKSLLFDPIGRLKYFLYSVILYVPYTIFVDIFAQSIDWDNPTTGERLDGIIVFCTLTYLLITFIDSFLIIKRANDLLFPEVIALDIFYLTRIYSCVLYLCDVPGIFIFLGLVPSILMQIYFLFWNGK